MRRSYSLLAVASGAERRPIAKIKKQFDERYQFNPVDVWFPRTRRNSIPQAQDCDLLLIGMSDITRGSTSLLHSHCPCVVWAPVWNASATKMLRRRGMEHRVRLVLLGAAQKRKELQLPRRIRVLHMKVRIKSENDLPEYKAALEIMCILLESAQGKYHAGGDCDG